MMLKHVPQEISMHGDLGQFSTQGGEHKNKQRKSRLHSSTNKRTASGAWDGKLSKDGTKRGKVVSRGRNVQLLVLEAATTELRKRVPSRKTHAQRKQIQ
jgi:hypothetical protein